MRLAISPGRTTRPQQWRKPRSVRAQNMPYPVRTSTNVESCADSATGAAGAVGAGAAIVGEGADAWSRVVGGGGAPVVQPKRTRAEASASARRMAVTVPQGTATAEGSGDRANQEGYVVDPGATDGLARVVDGFVFNDAAAFSRRKNASAACGFAL